MEAHLGHGFSVLFWYNIRYMPSTICYILMINIRYTPIKILYIPIIIRYTDYYPVYTNYYSAGLGSIIIVKTTLVQCREFAELYNNK